MAPEPARVGTPRIPPGVVSRPRLSARLDQHGRLTLVRGPAGYGKSTLVASWILQTDWIGDVLWISRADGLHSRAAYWAIVLADLERFTARPVIEPLDDLTVRASVIRAFAGLERPLLLVLDDFGAADDPHWAEICHDLRAALDAVPELSAVVIGRESLALESPDVAAEVIIASDELRIDAQEARRIADAAGLTEMADAALAALLQSADGIVFSFRYALEAVVHRSAAGDAAIARDLRERGEGLAAIPYALSGRDFDLAAELLVTHFVELNSSESTELSELVARIDPVHVAANPALALVTGLMSVSVTPDEAQTKAILVTAARAARARRQPHASARHRFGLAAGEAVVQRVVGRAAASIDAVRETLAAARDMSRGERAAMGAAFPLLLGQAGLSAFYALEPALAHACFSAELAASPRASFGRRRNVALAHLAMVSAIGGRMRRTERLLSEIVEADWALERRDRSPSAPYAIAAAYAAFNRGEVAEGIAILDAHGGDRPPSSENWALTAVARAIGRTLAGEASAAVEELEAQNAMRRSPGERVGVGVAGVETGIELLRLMSPEPVIGPAREAGLVGRAAVLLLVVRAVRAVLGGRNGTALEFIGRATRFGTSPFQELCAALAEAIVARRGSMPLAGAAERIGRIVLEQGLAWPLAILGEEDRAAILGELAETPSAGVVRAAFERIPPSVTLAPGVVEFHPRELAVLRDLAETASRVELAERSFVSVNTIKTQLRSLYRKLGVSTRDAALARARELGLLDHAGPSD